MLAGFGIPPIAHEDDPARAIGTALLLHERISELGWKCAIGLATGRIYCGAYGNKQRREYAMIGDTVNTSARLMQAAANAPIPQQQELQQHQPLPIVCDELTWGDAESKFDFTDVESIELKGKTKPVACYRPIARRKQSTTDSTKQLRVIGRKSEREVFERMLARISDDKESSIMFLEGEAGVGKSHLINSFEQRARKSHCRILTGRGEAIERSTPWFTWRPVIEALLGVTNLRLEADWLTRSILDRFDLDEETTRLLPLLSAVLPVSWPDNKWTAQMTGPLRAVNTNSLVCELIGQAAREDSLVIIIEDANWMDSSSLTLLREVSTTVHPMLTLVSARPLTRPVNRDCAVMLKLPITTHIELDVLPVEEAVQMAHYLLRADELPE